MFKSCNSLREIEFNLGTIKSSRMVMLDNMNFKQIQWCKKLGIIENIKSDVAKQLNMCVFYAIIPSELTAEFNSL